MTVHNVSNDSELSTAISSAVSGDEIVLANGNYGAFTWASKTYSPIVTMRAANNRQAVITARCTFSALNGVTFDGLDFTSGWEKGFGSYANLIWTECNIDALARLTEATDCTIEFCDLTNCGIWVNVGPSSGIIIRENYMHDRGGDSIVLSDVTDVQILNNVAFDALGSDSDPHWDLLVQTHTSSGAVTDVTIRGNIVIDDPATDITNTDGPSVVDGPQAIFCGGPSTGYTNFFIHQNMVYTGNANGVRLSNGAAGSYIDNNSLIGGNIVTDNQTGYDYSVPIRDNIVKSVTDEGGGGATNSPSGNQTFTSASDVFEDPTGGVYGIKSWQRFEPKTAYAAKGAATRYSEIQAGTNVRALELAGMTGMGGGGGATAQVYSFAGGLLMINGLVLKA